MRTRRIEKSDTCPCGLYIHPEHINPYASHIHDCPYNKMFAEMCDDAKGIVARCGNVVEYRTENGWCETDLGTHLRTCDACKLLKRKELKNE